MIRSKLNFGSLCSVPPAVEPGDLLTHLGCPGRPLWQTANAAASQLRRCDYSMPDGHSPKCGSVDRAAPGPGSIHGHRHCSASDGGCLYTGASQRCGAGFTECCSLYGKHDRGICGRHVCRVFRLLPVSPGSWRVSSLAVWRAFLTHLKLRSFQPSLRVCSWFFIGGLKPSCFFQWHASA
jgi:hypothetical protein